jgi:serine/threonine protein kinase HipA of HipAB toxin-antitoxin module
MVRGMIPSAVTDDKHPIRLKVKETLPNPVADTPVAEIIMDAAMDEAGITVGDIIEVVTTAQASKHQVKARRRAIHRALHKVT